MRQLFLRVALLVFLTICLPSAYLGATAAAAGNPGAPETFPTYADGELLVKYKPSVRAAAASAYKTWFDISTLREFRSTGWQRVRLPADITVEEALEIFLEDPDVEYAEPNYYIHAAATPDDPSFSLLWGLDNIGQIVNETGGTADADMDAPEAWDITSGSGDVIVAVVDTGVDYNHPDLAANIWINMGEIPANGLDDDGNGYIDDVRGWDFVNDDNAPQDPMGHGTRVAGTIAAEGNNTVGVTGVSWRAKIMPLKFMNAFGSGAISDAITAFEYANAMGAHVINNSWGAVSFSQALKDVIDASAAVVVCGSGNGSKNNDTSPFYPASYSSANIISVAASDQNDNLASFSNFGVVSVDVAAPGTNIYSTTPGRATVWRDNFDDNNIDDWTTGGTNTTWATTDAKKLSPSYSLTDSPGGNYQNDTDSWAMAPVIDLSARDGAKLTFKLMGSSENGLDLLTVEASTDLATWTEIVFNISGIGLRSRISGSYPTWTTFTADLGAYDGESTFYIRIHFKSNSATVDDGWYIDDVALTAASSSYSGTEYGYASATSFATPQVSGLAALIKAHNPSLTNIEIKAAIESNVDIKASLSGLVATGGRVNAANALTAPRISNVQISSITDTTATVEWTTDKPGNSEVHYGTGSSNWGSYPSSAVQEDLVTAHSVVLTGLSAGSGYYLRVGSTDAFGNGPDNIATDDNPSVEVSFNTAASDQPSIVAYPVIDFNNSTIDVAFDEPNMQNATVEFNYCFSPSINFVTFGGSDDITQIGDSSYRLAMASIPANEVITMWVKNIADVDGNPVTPDRIEINDNDADRMADDWEVANNLNPTVDDSLLDPDGDGYTNYQEYLCRTDPANPASVAFSIKDAIPPHNSGISNDMRVPDNSSFAVLLESFHGININDNESINFTIDDGVNGVYQRNLSSGAVRVKKLSDDDDSQVTYLWAVYDRSKEGALPQTYAYDQNVNIKIDAGDSMLNSMNQASYDFNVETLTEHDHAQDVANLPDIGSVGAEDPDLGGLYDEGIQVNSGELAGAKIIYDSFEPVLPDFGPLDEIPVLSLSNAQAVGLPLNFQPPTVFDTAVKIFIPGPGYTDVSNLSVYYYNGESWVQACDAAGNVLPGGEGWMVPNSRVNHNEHDPPTIEIRVYHFSGAQAGLSSGTGGSGGGGAGGCFIAAVSTGPGSLTLTTMVALLLIIGLISRAVFSIRRSIKR